MGELALTGEVLVTDSWTPTLGEGLDAGLQFRLVLLTSSENVTNLVQQDPRILVLAPDDGGRQRAIAESARGYGVLGRLREAIVESSGLRAFWSVSGDFLFAFRYAMGAVAPLTQRDLALDRASLLGQLSPGYLLEHPEVWAGISSTFQWFHARYRSLYREHHKAFREQTLALRHQLIGAQPKGEALLRLDRVPALASSSALSVVDHWSEVLSRTAPCQTQEMEETFVLVTPRCAACGVSLAESPSAETVKAVLDEMEDALQRQLKTLRSFAAKHVLAQSDKPRIELFLDLVQASDTRELVNILDDEVEEFLRTMLGDARREVYAAPVLSALRAKYETLEEGQIEEAVREFERLLTDAFNQARRQHQDAPVRLKLE